MSPADAGPRLVLIGPMGAGKTSVGRAVAQRLGVGFTDADHVIEEIAGQSIAEIFRDGGEERFRRLEAGTIGRLLRRCDGVLALGGGAVTTDSTRALLAAHTVVGLTVDREGAAQRISTDGGRPLIAGDDGLTRWQEVATARAAAYREVSDWQVDTSGRSIEDVATEIVAALAPQRDPLPGEMAAVSVRSDGREYPVIVGRGVLGHVPHLLPERAKRVFIVHQPTVRERAEALREQIAGTGRHAFLAEIPDAEQAKTAQVLAFLWQVLGQTDITRSDLIIGLGGGAATDLAGFAAASWLRGIDVLQIPTTVAGMVDAAVGGKTGINTAEGKNLVGAFHAPIAVLADLDVLATLPAHDIAAGLAEAVKAGFIADTAILELVEADPAAALDPASETFTEVMVRAIAVKAEVVSDDFTEQGRREILNYGHTLGHAIERNERYQWRHGAAVSVGMMFAAELAHLAGTLSEEEVDRHRRILTALGLPTTYRGRQWPKLEETMKRDKKTRGALLRFVVLDEIGRPSRLEGPDPALLLSAYDAIVED